MLIVVNGSLAINCDGKPVLQFEKLMKQCSVQEGGPCDTVERIKRDTHCLDSVLRHWLTEVDAFDFGAKPAGQRFNCKVVDHEGVHLSACCDALGA